MPKPIVETGLQKTIIEYIDSIGFSDHDNFNSNNHLDSFIDNLFRIDKNFEINIGTYFNQYLILTDFLSDEETGLPELSDRENKRKQLYKIMNKRADYADYHHDILSFNFNDDFYSEYSKLLVENKSLVCQMIMSHGLKAFNEYIKANHGNDTTYALILHIDENSFHIHRILSE